MQVFLSTGNSFSVITLQPAEPINNGQPVLSRLLPEFVPQGWPLNTCLTVHKQVLFQLTVCHHADVVQMFLGHQIPDILTLWKQKLYLYDSSRWMLTRQTIVVKIYHSNSRRGDTPSCKIGAWLKLQLKHRNFIQPMSRLQHLLIWCPNKYNPLENSCKTKQVVMDNCRCKSLARAD